MKSSISSLTLQNPRYGEHVKDPACGSADFLISAFRYVGRSVEDSKNCVWGSDNSEQAVQISILNMVLNGRPNPTIPTPFYRSTNGCWRCAEASLDCEREATCRSIAKIRSSCPIYARTQAKAMRFSLFLI